MSNISIEGLNKANVLAALYDASIPLGMGFLHFNPEPMEISEAEELIKEFKSFDYLHGRVMKVNLEGDEVDPWGYDRDNGEGSFSKVIESLRKG